MTLDNWNTFLQILSVALIGVTFAVAAAAFIVAYRVSKKQDSRIAEASSSAAFASNEAAGANARAADAVMRSQRLEIEAGVQRERAAKAEKELLELQQRLAGRVISPEQEVALVKHLARFKGENLQMNFITGVPEIEKYASQLAAAFQKAGWVVQASPTQVFGGTRSGHSLNVGGNKLGAANAIGEALLAAKLISGPLPADKNPNADLLNLWVWPKE